MKKCNIKFSQAEDRNAVLQHAKRMRYHGAIALDLFLNAVQVCIISKNTTERISHRLYIRIVKTRPVKSFRPLYKS